MKVNIWHKKKVTVFIGGEPDRNEPPVLTLEMESPQIKFDADKNIIIITETR